MQEHKQQRIAIVGAGIAGLCTAYYLLKAGHTPTLFDAGPIGSPPGAASTNATHAAAGMLAPTNELEFTELPLLHASLASLRLYDELEATLAPYGNIHLQRTGSLELALSPDDLPYLKRLFAFQQQQGLPVQWLSGAQARSHEPLLSHRIPGGIFAQHDAQVDNRALASALASYLQAQGCTLHSHTEVNVIEQNGSQLRLNAKPEAYAAIMLATGVAAPPALPAGTTPAPAIVPVRGEMLALQPGNLQLKHTIRYRSRAFGNGYIVPKATRWVVGSTSEERATDRRLRAGSLLDILRKAYAALPAIYDLPVTESWVGLRPSTLSRLPYIHQHTPLQVYSLNGLYRHGILLGPLMGQAAASTLLGKPLPPTVQALQTAYL